MDETDSYNRVQLVFYLISQKEGGCSLASSKKQSGETIRVKNNVLFFKIWGKKGELRVDVLKRSSYYHVRILIVSFP